MSLGKGDTPSAPNYTQLAERTAAANREQLMLQTGLNRPTEINPYGARQWALKPGADPNNPQPGDWVVADTLSPDQQGLLDTRENIQQGMGTAALGGIGRLQNMMSTGIDANGLPARSNAAIPDSEQAFSADRQRLEDAVYGRMTSRMDQRFARDEDSLRTQLTNKGLMEGSEAYNRALQDFQQNKNDAYANAQAQAIEMGGAEQSRGFSNLLSGISAADARRGNALNETLTLRQQPLNEMNALLGGTQLSGGGSAQFQPAGTAPGADYMNAGLAQYQAAMDRYNARAGGVGNAVNAGTALGSAWIMSSDRRLKSNITRIGTHKLGIGLYEYDIKGSRQRGVMADEVLGVMPEAVSYDAEGFAQVDYGMIGGL